MKKTRTSCTVEIAHTSRDFYAHVALEDNSIRPGDQVLVHNPPTEIHWGGQLRVEREATISRASWFTRWWTKWIARFELATLYEVSFSTARFSKSRRYPRPAARPDERPHSTSKRQIA
jgi:hypothetical protein